MFNPESKEYDKYNEWVSNNFTELATDYCNIHDDDFEEFCYERYIYEAEPDYDAMYERQRDDKDIEEYEKEVKDGTTKDI